jgi:AraC family transcriptional regulator
MADYTPKNGTILHGLITHHYWTGIQPLSLKSFYSGRALYTVDSASFAVDDAAYLIVNEDQPYTIEVKARSPIESLCIFFAPELVADVVYTSQASIERLLDDPQAIRHPIHFFERTYPHDHVISPKLLRLRSTLRQGYSDALWQDEQLHDLMTLIMHVYQNTKKEAQMLSAARAATRDELYRRLYHARDYMMAFFQSSVTINDLAHVACLSPNHLLRSFRQIFHQTPHQFLTTYRLNKAQQLLATTDLPITEICLMVGFISLGSFSTLFHHRVGMTPEAYRRHKQKR